MGKAAMAHQTIARLLYPSDMVYGFNSRLARKSSGNIMIVRNGHMRLANQPGLN